MDTIKALPFSGKSTTTAMFSMVLKEMGNDISALVGANVSQVWRLGVKHDVHMRLYLMKL